jgi:hypothetical protein
MNSLIQWFQNSAGANPTKLLNGSLQARVFANGKHFQPSQKFVGKAGAYRVEHLKLGSLG